MSCNSRGIGDGFAKIIPESQNKKWKAVRKKARFVPSYLVCVDTSNKC